MVDEYLNGADVVYGVRSSRKKDSFFKRFSAESFYRLMSRMGVDTVFNHADYRLASARVLDALEEFGEVNLYLRGVFPLIGFRSATVYYERNERFAGETHYPLGKMIRLALDGITGFTAKPLGMIFGAGIAVSVPSFIGFVVTLILWLCGVITSAAPVMLLIALACGVQLTCTGVLGEYVGRIYLEAKHRPKYFIMDRTDGEEPGL